MISDKWLVRRIEMLKIFAALVFLFSVAAPVTFEVHYRPGQCKPGASGEFLS